MCFIHVMGCIFLALWIERGEFETRFGFMNTFALFIKKFLASSYRFHRSLHFQIFAIVQTVQISGMSSPGAFSLSLVENKGLSSNMARISSEGPSEASSGTWRTDPVDIELKDDSKPHHARPYPVPKIHKEVFKKEVARLCKLGYSEK